MKIFIQKLIIEILFHYFHYFVNITIIYVKKNKGIQFMYKNT